MNPRNFRDTSSDKFLKSRLQRLLIPSALRHPSNSSQLFDVLFSQNNSRTVSAPPVPNKSMCRQADTRPPSSTPKQPWRFSVNSESPRGSSAPPGSDIKIKRNLSLVNRKRSRFLIMWQVLIESILGSKAEVTSIQQPKPQRITHAAGCRKLFRLTRSQRRRRIGVQPISWCVIMQSMSFSRRIIAIPFFTQVSQSPKTSPQPNSRRVTAK